jgi:hypothetical protein
MLPSRLAALVVLLIVSNVCAAAFLRLDFRGPVLQEAGTVWLGPGPVPESFEASVVIDTQLFSSRQLIFADYQTGVGPRLDSYTFHDVEVASIVVLADGEPLWTDPEGLTLTFRGDNPSLQGLGGYFAGFEGTNPAGRSFHVTYDSFPGLTSGQTLLHGDSLANILAGQQGFVASLSRFSGDWGVIAGTPQMQVAIVPEPAMVWLSLTGLVALGLATRQQWAKL